MPDLTVEVKAFDWGDFFTLAQELAARGEESCIRTAISRAYYFAFHLGRQRIDSNGFILVIGGDSHKQVWEKFNDSPDYACKKLYLLALKLKDKRQRADYDKVYAKVAEDATEVLRMAQEFGRGLAALSPRLPANSGARR